MPELEFKAYAAKAVKELRELKLSNELLVFLNKYIFSCLIDADRLNTATFESGEDSQIKENHNKFFIHYYDRLLSHLEKLEENNDFTDINHLRKEMSVQCDEYAVRQSGIYSLSIPTGGGKTLASLRYALKHSLKHKKERIIYVLPYTTIIEQNASEVRQILNDERNILEHHSNVIEERTSNNDEVTNDVYIRNQERLRLAKDNWDSPTIFTTLVQFLNVFYGKSNRNTRRLHNLTNSIIIFDEVQKVPTKCIGLFNASVNFLKKKRMLVLYYVRLHNRPWKWLKTHWRKIVIEK